MCSSQGICNSGSRPNNRSSSSETSGSGAHYALCALGVGLIALGVVMIIWTVIPMDGEQSRGSPTAPTNSTVVPHGEEDEKETEEANNSSVVAMVLVGVGAVLLLLSICLGVRSKRRARNRSQQPAVAGGTFMDHVAGQEEES